MPAKVSPPPIVTWRRSQTCLLALAIDDAWLCVRDALERATAGVLSHIQNTRVFTGRVPHTSQLVLVCNRRRARNDASAKGAALPADLECIAADLLALYAQRRLEKRQDMNAVAAALTAAMALWDFFIEQDRKARHAPKRMDELRKRKGLK